MPRKHLTLEQWIREALHDEDKESPCTALSLVHLSPHGSSQKEVHSVALSGKTYEDSKLALLFQSKAEGYAQDLGGIQTFVLLAFYGEPEPRATHPFKIIDGELSSGPASHYVAESPDAKGLTAQLMRHLETVHRTTTAFMQEMMLRSMGDRQQLQHELFDANSLIRELVLKAGTEQHESRMKEMQYQRSSEERQKILALAPALVNTMTGREVLPQSTVDTALIEGLARKIDPKIIEQLIGTGLVPEHLAAPLLARFQEITQLDKQKQAELAKVPGAGADEPGAKAAE